MSCDSTESTLSLPSTAAVPSFTLATEWANQHPSQRLLPSTAVKKAIQQLCIQVTHQLVIRSTHPSEDPPPVPPSFSLHGKRGKNNDGLIYGCVERLVSVWNERLPILFRLIDAGHVSHVEWNRLVDEAFSPFFQLAEFGLRELDEDERKKLQQQHSHRPYARQGTFMLLTYFAGMIFKQCIDLNYEPPRLRRERSGGGERSQTDARAPLSQSSIHSIALPALRPHLLELVSILARACACALLETEITEAYRARVVKTLTAYVKHDVIRSMMLDELHAIASRPSRPDSSPSPTPSTSAFHNVCEYLFLMLEEPFHPGQTVRMIPFHLPGFHAPGTHHDQMRNLNADAEADSNVESNVSNNAQTKRPLGLFRASEVWEAMLIQEPYTDGEPSISTPSSSPSPSSSSSLQQQKHDQSRRFSQLTAEWMWKRAKEAVNGATTAQITLVGAADTDRTVRAGVQLLILLFTHAPSFVDQQRLNDAWQLLLRLINASLNIRSQLPHSMRFVWKAVKEMSRLPSSIISSLQPSPLHESIHSLRTLVDWMTPLQRTIFSNTANCSYVDLTQLLVDAMQSWMVLKMEEAKTKWNEEDEIQGAQMKKQRETCSWTLLRLLQLMCSCRQEFTPLPSSSKLSTSSPSLPSYSLRLHLPSLRLLQTAFDVLTQIVIWRSGNQHQRFQDTNDEDEDKPLSDTHDDHEELEEEEEDPDMECVEDSIFDVALEAAMGCMAAHRRTVLCNILRGLTKLLDANVVPLSYLRENAPRLHTFLMQLIPLQRRDLATRLTSETHQLRSSAFEIWSKMALCLKHDFASFLPDALAAMHRVMHSKYLMRVDMKPWLGAGGGSGVPSKGPGTAKSVTSNTELPPPPSSTVSLSSYPDDIINNDDDYDWGGPSSVLSEAEADATSDGSIESYDFAVIGWFDVQQRSFAACGVLPSDMAELDDPDLDEDAPFKPDVHAGQPCRTSAAVLRLWASCICAMGTSFTHVHLHHLASRLAHWFNTAKMGSGEFYLPLAELGVAIKYMYPHLINKTNDASSSSPSLIHLSQLRAWDLWFLARLLRPFINACKHLPDDVAAAAQRVQAINMLLSTYGFSLLRHRKEMDVVSPTQPCTIHHGVDAFVKMAVATRDGPQQYGKVQPAEDPSGSKVMSAQESSTTSATCTKVQLILEASTFPDHHDSISRHLHQLLLLIIQIFEGSSSATRAPTWDDRDHILGLVMDVERVREQMAINRAWREACIDASVDHLLATRPPLEQVELPDRPKHFIPMLPFHSLASGEQPIEAETMSLNGQQLRLNAFALFGHILYGLGCTHQLDRYAAVIEPVWRLADIIRQSSQQYEAAWMVMATNAVRGWIKQSEWENINHRSPSTSSSPSPGSSSPSIPSASSDCHDAAIHPRAISLMILPTLQHALNILSDSSHPSVSPHTQSHSSSNSMIDARQSAAEALRVFSHVIERGSPSPLLPHLMPDSQRMKNAMEKIEQGAR